MSGGAPAAAEHDDEATLVYIQGHTKSLRERALAALLGQIIEPPFFDVLRTERKLGYLVFATTMTMFEVPGLGFAVQSPSTPWPPRVR